MTGLQWTRRTPSYAKLQARCVDYESRGQLLRSVTTGRWEVVLVPR